MGERRGKRKSLWRNPKTCLEKEEGSLVKTAEIRRYPEYASHFGLGLEPKSRTEIIFCKVKPNIETEKLVARFAYYYFFFTNFRMY